MSKPCATSLCTIRVNNARTYCATCENLLHIRGRLNHLLPEEEVLPIVKTLISLELKNSEPLEILQVAIKEAIETFKASKMDSWTIWSIIEEVLVPEETK